jgi:hypothetical protein
MKNKFINDDSEKLSDITMKEIKNALKEMKNNKSLKIIMKSLFGEKRISLFNSCLTARFQSNGRRPR